MTDYLDCDIDAFVRAAHALVEHDECMRALQLLDNIPAYYRDHIPESVATLKKLINAKIFTVSDYADNPHDNLKSTEFAVSCVNGTARGVIIRDLVSNYNIAGVQPHIVDLGPGEFWLPMGLDALRLKFTYRGIGLKNDTQRQIKEALPEVICETDRSPTLFVATEIIEHLSDEKEIRRCFDRIAGKVEHVLVSTPKYHFLVQKRWKEEGIGHLRGYTPREFTGIVVDMFIDYTFKYYEDRVMLMHGSLINT